MVVDSKYNDRDSGYWKFNTKFLSNKQFVELLNSEINQTIQCTKDRNPADRWEIIKARIKKTAAKFSREYASEEKNIICNLTEQVNNYESRFHLTEEEDKLLLHTKAELEEKVLERASGVMFRSKAKWYEEGEKNTKYFFALEKAKYNRKTCFKIIGESGEEVDDQVQILSIQRDFYQDLYRVDQDVNFNMENIHGIYVLVDIQQKQQEQISRKDLLEAIKLMNNNKTPGQDGLLLIFIKYSGHGYRTCSMT